MSTSCAASCEDEAEAATRSWIERITKLFLAKLGRVAKYFLFAQLTVRIDGAPAASGGGISRELHPELPRFISFAPLRACPLACFSAHPKKLLC